MRRLWFWVRRYGVAELAGLVTLCAAALPFQATGHSIAVVTAAAVVGELFGFYLAMFVQVHREQRRAHPLASRAVVLRRSTALLVAEFGPAELLDTLLVRPAALALALWAFGNTAAVLVAGKLVADVAFYLLAALAYWATARFGWRTAKSHD